MEWPCAVLIRIEGTFQVSSDHKILWSLGICNARVIVESEVLIKSLVVVVIMEYDLRDLFFMYSFNSIKLGVYRSELILKGI